MVGIYKIINQINNKIYVGQSQNIEKRWNRHHNGPFNPNDEQYNCPLYRAIRKYGLDNFSFEIIEECSVEQLNEKEKYWIAYYKSFDPDKGYNLTRGGRDGVTYSKLTKEKVMQIIELLQSSSLSQEQIGRQFNISQREVSGINKGENWTQTDINYPIRNRRNERGTCPLCGQSMAYGAKKCKNCFLKEKRNNRPSREELKQLIRKLPFVIIGKIFNVTDNAIRKWCKAYNLPYRKKDINQYSDEDWAAL